ncbi:hypothetical protein DV736_g3938, partial [Chaetothyriales sp. CBS 134916]
MQNQPMDAEASFTYLNDQLPLWLTQLNDLSRYASGKSEEFAAEYRSLVNGPRRKRLKSTSLQSIHSVDSPSARATGVASRADRADASHSIPSYPTEVSTLEGQRKRKKPWSIRSSQPRTQQPRCRSQVVYYDSHIQVQLDCMVKAIGIARNNLRKARNAHQAAHGFSLPTLKHKGQSALMNSLDNLRSSSKQQSALAISNSKFILRSSCQPTSENDLTLFSSADKQLETVQGLYETAAYQFLRDGECKGELDSAKNHLDTLAAEAQKSLNAFQEKAARKRKEDTSCLDSDVTETASDSSQRPSTISFEPLQIVKNEFGPTQLSQTLEDMKQRPMLNESGPTDLSYLSTAGAVIEVNDDESDEESIGDIDMSQFRATNVARLARAY